MNKAKILVVDDKKENVYALKELLQGENRIIFEAYSGEECLVFLLKETVDVVLLDIQMPRIDGYETATLIRQNERTKTIPIIFVTAASKTESMNLKGYEHGAIDIIYKPINPVILMTKVHLFLEMAETRRQLEEQVHLLTVLNEENRKMQEEIEKLALQDYLTGIPNRRKIDTDFTMLYRDAYRYKKSIAVIMIDLDNFKEYNDQYGHTEGDKVLKIVANKISENLLRSLDTLGRFGGEEFMVVLPNTNEAGAMKIAEKIRKEIYNLKIQHCPTCPRKYVSISLGVAAEIPEEYDQELLLLKKSDKALYEAKDLGKNQSVLYTK